MTHGRGSVLALREPADRASDVTGRPATSLRTFLAAT